MKGRGGAVLYLDFDGVLHPEAVYWRPQRGAYIEDSLASAGQRLFEHAELLIELLAPFPHISIVLSTSWARHYRFSKAARKLPISLRQRVIGATFHSQMDKVLFDRLSRGRQVLSDVERRQPAAWLAIDDTDEGWGNARGNVVISDERFGIAEPSVLRKLRDSLHLNFERSNTQSVVIGAVRDQRQSDHR